ncbi:MAG TPA: CDP-alcohol phosphatidyltransferase family protein, partial [Moraxellaceae bacterium]|nr:CDP-alcohol phosphatidyltransferase family protein [Moraxellaceae bacterium]
MLRVALIPVLVALAYLPYDWRFLVSALVFLLAAITDWFDGYLARRLNQSTAFGRFLDPVADKLMVAAALVILVQWHHDRVLVVISAII